MAASPAAGLEELMGNKNKGGGGSNKTPATKSIKEKRQEKRAKKAANESTGSVDKAFGR